MRASGRTMKTQHSHLSAPAAAVVSLAWIAVGATVHAQEIDRYLPKPGEPCAGELEKRHSNTPWDFTTNSRKPTAQDPTLYLHCVFNNGSGAVEVNWRIPQVSKAIAIKESALSSRYSLKGPVGQPDGCLIYGALKDKALKAQFWAREEDKAAIAEEDGKNCLSFRTASASGRTENSEKPRGMVAPFRIFLPLKPSAPTEALVAFEGIVGVRKVNPSGTEYESFLTYRLRGVQGVGTDAIAKEYQIVPRWEGPVERLAEYFNKAMDRPRVAMRAEGGPVTISFPVAGSGKWSFHELEYQIRDSANNLAARLFVPAFVPL
jgi:hypothetical protein